ncbi:MAG: translation initiation factor IF-1 [bacterium]
MTKNDVIEVNGKVIEVLPDSKYRVEIELGTTKKLVLGYLSGKMKKNHIQVTVGDSVLIEFTPYDLEKGRVTRRFNPERNIEQNR